MPADEYTYKQKTKNEVRHKSIKHAIETLTTFRSEACCVRRSYVRDLYDYFVQLDETHEKEEAKKIDISYIREWEHIHTNNIGTKRPDELVVCYLSGPEPENDFHEFISMGVKPQNIWAFESERNTYLKALSTVDGTSFMQPKLIKTNIERFFEMAPRTFDIVYIDACASIISEQHALRAIATLFKCHRLNSPGVLISNFSYLDDSTSSEKNQYIDIISRYNFIKSNRNASLIEDCGNIRYINGFDEEKKIVEDSLIDSYGEFITSMIYNTASIAVPTVRFCNSNYLQSLTNTLPLPVERLEFKDVNVIKDNTLHKFFFMNLFLEQNRANFDGVNKAKKLLGEMTAQQGGYDLISSMKKLHEVRFANNDICSEIVDTVEFFNKSNSMYQFLDKPNGILFFDSVINQLSSPMHYVSDKALRFTYVAKKKRMFTDVLLFDDCRYIYDWLPAIHQIPKAFSNLSWQYTYRFALDGLIKQRLYYNNEFFFSGSVVSKTTLGFEAKKMKDRIHISQE